MFDVLCVRDDYDVMAVRKNPSTCKFWYHKSELVFPVWCAEMRHEMCFLSLGTHISTYLKFVLREG